MISLNLLPPERKEAFYWRTLTKNSIFWGGKFLSILVFFFIPFLVLNFYLKTKIGDLDARIRFFEQTKEIHEINSLEKSSKSMNDALLNIDKISENQIYWTDVFKTAVKNFPANVQIFSLEIAPAYAKNETLSASEGKFIIIGQAKTRDDVLALEKNLKASADFKDIKSPLENLVKRNDVDFKFTGTFVLKNFRAGGKAE